MLDKLLGPSSGDVSEQRGPLRGRGGGMDDKIGALIKSETGSEPALLSRDEYVVPADVVSMLGDGSSARGAEILDTLCEEIRRVKSGSKKQAKPLKSLLAKMVNI